MFQNSYRLVKRFAILIPGFVIAYFSVRDIFPYFDRRLPLGFAILVTYAIAAYVLIPALIRLFRIINPPTHLPLYCVTPDGFASDPLNIGVISTRKELIKTMEAAGWKVADRHNAKNVLRMVFSIIFEHPYENAPVSSLYLFGRKQDIAFEIPIGRDPSTRHHVRFWATTYTNDQPLSIRSIHWNKRKEHVYADNLLWVGAASLDVGLAFIRHTFQVSHMIHPDTNSERDLIVKQLKRHTRVKQVDKITLGQPYKLINRVMRGSLHTDGVMSIVSFKK